MYLTIDNQQYWVRTFGERKGIPIIFLHGFTGTHKTWEPTITQFSTSHWCVVIDLPGHGKTQIDTPITMEEFCDHFVDMLDQLAIEQAHLVGYSMGGRVALSFALLHSKRVDTLTLESATPGLRTHDEQTARQTRDELLACQIETKGIRSFVTYWEELPLFASQKNLTIAVWNRIKKERLSQTPTGLAASLRGMGTGMQPSWWDELANLSVPLLLIVGQLDEKFVMIAKEIKQKYPTAEIHTISQAGHAIHVEQREKFDTIVESFIMRMEE